MGLTETSSLIRLAATGMPQPVLGLLIGAVLALIVEREVALVFRPETRPLARNVTLALIPLLMLIVVLVVIRLVNLI